METMPKVYRSKMLVAVHDTAVFLHRYGAIEQKTMRRFDALCLKPAREKKVTDRGQQAERASVL